MELTALFLIWKQRRWLLLWNDSTIKSDFYHIYVKLIKTTLVFVFHKSGQSKSQNFWGFCQNIFSCHCFLVHYLFSNNEDCYYETVEWKVSFLPYLYYPNENGINAEILYITTVKIIHFGGSTLGIFYCCCFNIFLLFCHIRQASFNWLKESFNFPIARKKGVLALM